LINNGSKNECQCKDDIINVNKVEPRSDKKAVSKVKLKPNKKVISKVDKKDKVIKSDVKLEEIWHEEVSKSESVIKPNGDVVKPLKVKGSKKLQRDKTEEEPEIPPINGNKIIDIEYFMVLAVQAFCVDKESKGGGYASSFAEILRKKINEVKNKWNKPKIEETD
jgi:hypothetical protein